MANQCCIIYLGNKKKLILQIDGSFTHKQMKLALELTDIDYIEQLIEIMTLDRLYSINFLALLNIMFCVSVMKVFEVIKSSQRLGMFSAGSNFSSLSSLCGFITAVVQPAVGRTGYKFLKWWRDVNYRQRLPSLRPVQVTIMESEICNFT